jgi:hypothetical protein
MHENFKGHGLIGLMHAGNRLQEMSLRWFDPFIMHVPCYAEMSVVGLFRILDLASLEQM